MTDDAADAAEAPPSAPQPASRMRGCLQRVIIGGVALIAIYLLTFFFVWGPLLDQGGDADQPERGVNAGLAEAYLAGDVSFLEGDHIWVVRLANGDFLPLYDKSPKQQELDRDDCRVVYDEQAPLNNQIEQLPPFTGAFVEECEGQRTVWRADGVRAFGAGYGDLDRFRYSINEEGELIIDVRRRTCTRSLGVRGIEPFVQRECSGNG